MISKTLFRCVAVFLITFFLPACAPPGPEAFDSDQALFKEAERYFERKQYSSATDYYQSLVNRFPRSPLAKQSLLQIGNAHFKAAEYLEAAYEYQNFKKLYPKAKEIPYVILQIGRSHSQRARKAPERDQRHSRSALYHYNEVIENYPQSPAAEKAVKRASQARAKLIEKNLYVANFYLNQKKYGAAIPRFIEVAQTYEFENLREEALYKLAWAYYKLERLDKSKEFAQKTLENKDEGHHRKAQRLIQKIKK